MKGKKKKLTGEKKGFPWGTDWQRGFYCFRILNHWFRSSVEFGQMNARRAVLGMVSENINIIKKSLK